MNFSDYLNSIQERESLTEDALSYQESTPNPNIDLQIIADGITAKVADYHAFIKGFYPKSRFNPLRINVCTRKEDYIAEISFKKDGSFSGSFSIVKCPLNPTGHSYNLTSYKEPLNEYVKFVENIGKIGKEIEKRLKVEFNV